MAGAIATDSEHQRHEDAKYPDGWHGMEMKDVLDRERVLSFLSTPPQQTLPAQGLKQ